MEWPRDNKDVTGAAGGLPIHPGCSVRTSRRSLRHRRCVGNPHTFDCFCPVVCGRSIFASGDPVSRRARCENRHRFAIMVPPPSMVPAPLPSLTLAQIRRGTPTISTRRRRTGRRRPHGGGTVLPQSVPALTGLEARYGRAPLPRRHQCAAIATGFKSSGSSRDCAKHRPSRAPELPTWLRRSPAR
jgi:hypothetical protein